MGARWEMAMREINMKAEAQNLSWFRKNYKRVYEDSGIPPEWVPKSAKVLYGLMVKWEEEAKEKAEEEKIRLQMEKPPERIYKQLVLKKTELERETMLPVHPDTLKTLYEGISHNGEGRLKYLIQRNRLAPYHKYYDPIAYGMDIGWKIEERALPPSKKFATNQVIKAEFYRRYGVKRETLRNRLPMPSGRFTTEQL